METTTTPVPVSRTWRLWARPATPRPFHVTDRDVELLRLTLRYRFIRPEHARLLLGASPKKIKNRLRVLWESCYLERPKALRTTKPLLEEIAYALGQEGARYLAHVDPMLRGLADVEWAETPRRSVGWPNLTHQLGVVDVLVALELACQMSGITFEWDGHPNRRRHRLVTPEGEPFYSDAFFRMRGPRGVAHVHLEYDRANVGLARMKARYQHYFRCWQDRAAREPGYRFRVLTITEDTNYLQSLRRAARDIGRDAHHPKAWHGLIFTHRGAFSLERPETILDPILFYADEETPVALA